ncbi:hypothetical protein RFI_37346, partial [Reticulomyxa filosa]
NCIFMGKSSNVESSIPMSIAHSFEKNYHINDNNDDEKKDEIEYLWLMIMNELHIPQWNLNDTKCIIYSMNGLLLDGLVGLNEQQLNDAIKCLMGIFENEKIIIFNGCVHALVNISLQLGEKQLGNAFQYLIHRFFSYFF